MDAGAIRAEVARLEDVVARLRRAVGDGDPPDDAAAEAVSGDDPETAWDASGLWKGELVEDDTHVLTLQLHQEGAVVSGSMIIAYELDDEPYCAVEAVAGTVTGRDVWLAGTSVRFMPPDPDADYSMDVLELTMFAKGAEMSGRWQDSEGDANGRAQLQRVAE